MPQRLRVGFVEIVNSPPRRGGFSVAAAALLVLSACSAKKPTEQTYFDRTIKPILQDSCVSTNTGANCHTTDAKGNAFGNLGLSRYDEIAKRRDLLVNYGPYGLPNMLLKNVDSFGVRITAYDGTEIAIKTDIRHAGGKTIGLTSAGFNTLKRWINDGASESNAPLPVLPAERDDCSETFPTVPGFDPNPDPNPPPDFQDFKQNVQPILGDTCAAGNCHGSESNSLRLVCAESSSGNSDVLARWNYYQATQYLATQQQNLGASEILRRPLDPAAGGSYHEGGAIFSSQSDPGYQAILNWANAHGPNTNVPKSRGFEFFAKRVQPMLVKKGCMVLGCHSPAMFHDYRLRGGSSGNFSVPTTLTNYELTLEQVAMESLDPSASRLIAKNLLRPDEQVGGRGIQHRGGSLFDDFPAVLASPSLCDSAAAETGNLDDQHAYCVISRWIQIEQEDAKLKPLSGVVYVKKKPAPGADTPQDYAVYSPSSDLCFTPLTMTPGGAITPPAGGGTCKSLLGTCAGLAVATADIRHPSVSWKGDQVAFAARSSAAEPFAVWTVNVDGSACAKQADIVALPAAPGWTDNGAPIHNFDPVFTPDGRIVFASTRGNVMNTAAFDYQGPQHTPADPAKWNANLYILDAPGKIRQLTFLLNQEILPSMMSDGRLIFTTEKRAPGFYQLAGRRLNLDGGDYHPLFAQRRTIGFDQMTEVVELANKNLAAVFSNRGAVHGAGTLGILNRSLGPDHHSPNAADYSVDPGAMSWPEPKFFLHSLCFEGTGNCQLPAATAGAYRSPAPLPNGNLVVSFAANVMDVTSFSGNFDLYVVDEISGARTQLTNDPANDEIFPVAVYQRFDRGVFKSRPDEANAHTRVYVDGEDPAHPVDRSEVTILNVSVLGSLLFQNTRTGRSLPPLDNLEVYEDLPPDLGETSLAVGSGYVGMDAYGPVYARRRSLGTLNIYDDGSAAVALPGGLPIVLAGIFALDGGGPAHHFQREEMQFYPGEYAHQSFPLQFFNGFCGGCHGSLSGYENDIAVQPDILTQASRVRARSSAPSVMVDPPGQRGSVVGPIE
jgi:hypothetical protein